MDENKLYRLYSKGSEKIQKELDVIKLLKKLRNMKIFLAKKNLMGPMEKLRVENSG